MDPRPLAPRARLHRPPRPRPRRLFLRPALGLGRRRHRLLPFTFTAATKSELGWAFLAICDTGRFRDHALDGTPAQAEFAHQVAAAQYELLPGPGRRLRGGVRRRHDDLLISAALCGVLDGEPWGSGESVILPPDYDMLDDRRWSDDDIAADLDRYADDSWDHEYADDRRERQRLERIYGRDLGPPRRRTRRRIVG